MQLILKIVLIQIFTISYLIPNFNSIRTDGKANLLPKAQSQTCPMFTLSASNLADLSNPSAAGNKILNGKLIKIKNVSLAPGDPRSMLKGTKTYQLDNDIHFNFPLISYKFSLREYTEGS